MQTSSTAFRCSTPVTGPRDCFGLHRSAGRLNGAILAPPSAPRSVQGRGTVVVKALRTKGGQKQKTSKRTDGDRVAEPVDSVISSPTAYGALGALYSALAVPAALFPHSAANFLFGAAAEPHDMLHEPLFRILAAGLATAGAVSFALRAGAKSGDLDSSVNKRLEIGLVVFVTINTLLQTTSAAQPGSVLTFPGFWATALILGLTVTSAWGGFGKASDQGLSLKRAGPLPAIKKFQDDTADFAGSATGSGLTSTLYTVLTAGFFAAGVGYLYAPEFTLQAVFNDVKGDECVFLWRAIGAALVSLVSVTSYSLREGAADGSLGTAPFKLLNIGLSGASLIHLLVLAPLIGGEHAGPFLLPLLGTWGASFALSSANLLRGGDDS